MRLFLVSVGIAVQLFFFSICFSQESIKMADYLMEYGKYEKAIVVLNSSLHDDFTKKNWLSWINKKKKICDCYYKLDIPDSLINCVNEIEKTIKVYKINNPIALCEFYEAKARTYFLKEDIDAGFELVKKSYALKLASNHTSDIDLFTTHLLYTASYNYKGDQANTILYAKKLLHTIQKNKTAISKYKLTEAYLQIGDATIMQPDNNDSATAWNLYKKSEKFYFLALKEAKNNPFLKRYTLLTIATFYYLSMVDMSNNGWQVNKSDMQKKANYYCDKAIETIKTEIDSSSLIYSILMSRIYILKGYMYEHNYPKLALKFYNESLYNLVTNWDNKNDDLNTPDSLTFVLKKPLVLTSLSMRTDVLLELYSLTSEQKYLEAAFKTIDLASQLSKKILSEYQSSSPYQILNIYNNIPFQQAIGISYALFEKTHNEFYRHKILEYSECNKYSDIIKGFLQSLKKEKTQEFNTTLVSSDIITFNEIQQQISDNNCIIEYTFDLDGNLYGIVITKNKFDVVKLEVIDEVLDTKIIALRDAIEKSDIENYKQSAFELYQILLAPIVKKISKKVNQLTIVPDKMLSLIPFEALLTNIDNQHTKDYRNLNYLIRSYAIKEQLSLTTAKYLNHKTTNVAPMNILGIAAGKITGMNNLPYSLKSLNYIENKYSGCFLYDTAASVKNFKALAPNATIIFFASHAKGNISNSNESKIYLNNSSGSGTENTSLSLDDIYQLKLNSELTILSACETSIGEYQTGEGIISFERAFVFAGSKSVLSTLWKTDDQANYQILTTFIDKLSNYESKHKALFDTKIDFLNNAKTSDDANPLYWAGFTLVGCDSPVKLEVKEQFPILMIVSIVFLIGLTGFGIVLYKKRRNTNRKSH